MEEIVNKKLCCGCTACASICPRHAITMEKDNDGFMHPVVDKTKCVNCGLCQRTCPVLNTKNNNSINNCFVGYAKNDEILSRTSSGGIFPLVANYVLDNNGIVIGVAFNDENKLEHIAVTKKDDLYKLMGSKYLQSDLNNIFRFIKDNLKDKKILFVGTPCQVAGLKAVIKNDLDNLYCIDVVCHGAPSPKLFNKYIKELESKYNDKLVNYYFRDKSTGWDTYSNTIELKNNKVSELHKDNKYMKLFLSDIALRESCYNCNFKLGNKYSDITLGDFWGINNYYPEMYNKKGVSAIIVNTEKGKEIFDIISNNIEYKECKLEEITNGNPSLKTSSKRPSKRDQFFNELDSKDIDYLTKKYANVSLSKRIFKKIKKVIKKILLRLRVIK